MKIQRYRNFTLLLLLAMSLQMTAQRSYIGIGFGASFPTEEFARTSLTENGGYALPGFVLDFSGAYIFDYFFGIAGTATFSNNSPDVDQLLQDLIAAIPDPPPGADIDDAIFNHGQWMYANIMVGPIFTLPVWKLNFDLRGVAGLSFLVSPPWELTLIKDGESYTESRSGNTVNFAYMLGPGIRYNVNEEIGLRLASDYFRSSPTFSLRREGITGDTNYDMNVGTISITLGITYRF